MKKVATWLLVLTSCLFLTSCGDKADGENKVNVQENKIEKSEQSSSKTVKYDKNKQILTLENAEIKFTSFESKKDIDDRDGLFVYAEFKNTSKEETLVPSTLWSAHVSFAEDSDKTTDTFYPGVMQKEDLDDSEYRKAIDNINKEVKAGETATIGYFYLTEGKKIKQIIYDEDYKVVSDLSIKLD